MLGEQIGEERGQVLARRVLPGTGTPQVEVTIEARGRMLGIDHTHMATYTATVQPDGSLCLISRYSKSTLDYWLSP